MRRARCLFALLLVACLVPVAAAARTETERFHKVVSLAAGGTLKLNIWGLVVLMNWQMVGYMMIIYIAGIQGISTEVVEAAQIDGANCWPNPKKYYHPFGHAGVYHLHIPHGIQFIQTV